MYFLGIKFESYLLVIILEGYSSGAIKSPQEYSTNVLNVLRKVKKCYQVPFNVLSKLYFVNFSACLRTSICQCLRMDLSRRIDLYKKSSEVRVISHGLLTVTVRLGFPQPRTPKIDF